MGSDSEDLCTYLNTSLSEIYLHGQIFACEDVRIMGLGEGSFQFFQLVKRIIRAIRIRLNEIN